MSVPKISFSTTGIPRDKVTPLWSDVLNQVKVGGQAVLEDEKDFFATVESCIFGTTVMNFWIINKFQYNRTQRDCARNPNTDYSLFYVRSGTAEISQNNRVAKIRAGDCLFINMAEPYLLTNTSFLHLTTLHIASDLIKSLLPSPRNMTAIVLPKQSVWVAALAATLHAFTPQIIEQPFYMQRDLFGHICSLLSLTADPKKLGIKDSKISMLNRFRQSLYDHFYRAGLCPKNVAEEHKISTRTLHSVFASAKSSFGRELLAIRMDRASHILRDPRFNNKTIAEIGYLVGFLRPSHFTTRFSKTFGMTPTAYRTLQQADFERNFVKR
jgi:AraC-like DNA-binding protein